MSSKLNLKFFDFVNNKISSCLGEKPFVFPMP
jgi:hypothetical protein